MSESLLPSTPITELSGVGKTRAEKLRRLGINTLRDLVYYFPRAHEPRGNIIPLSAFTPDANGAYLLTVTSSVSTAKVKHGLTISKFRAFDESGSVEIVFFNSPFIKDVFHVGDTFRFYGKIALSRGRLQMTNPKYEPYLEGVALADFIPVYPSTDGMSSKQLDKLIKVALQIILPQIKDYIPENIRISNHLPSLSYAIKNAHSPESEEALRRSLSRLAFDEILTFGIGISMSGAKKSQGVGIRFSPCSLEPLTSLLPFELTPSQKAAVNDFYSDMVIGKNGQVSPMARILVGDVGTGKTICAVMAMYIAATSKYQSALMVPTEILARQHYEDVNALLSQLGIRTELLLGSTTKKEKNRIYQAIEAGECDIVIGTHALISEKLEFSKLGLVITDEQHRFGVNQRSVLKGKAENAHMLVMSATPIPRTLALSMYGDLDVSRITDTPKGRMRVDTYVVDESYRARLNDFIYRQVKSGGQCYIVCPAIEAEDDASDLLITDSIDEALVSARSLNLKNTEEYAKELKKQLPNVSIEVLHGKMKATEKDEIMTRFSNGEIDVLVSTTVIEVGVNVPNASLMIVENAERFGLSQLHQLRGRVGRGTRKSFCVLVSDLKSEKSRARLDIMKSTYDGFEIAEKDLLLRGPGDFFSSNTANNLRQSGGFEFKFASKCSSSEIFDAAFSAAKSIVKIDPELTLPEHQLLRAEIEKHISINLLNLS